jgi:hypothetical protein
MNMARYKIVFTGQIIEGNTIGDVKKRIEDHFKIGKEKIERLFSGRPVLIRKNVDFITARRIQSIFQKAGALCQMIEIKDEEPKHTQSNENTAAPPVVWKEEETFVPLEILHWNWSAFTLTWIWGLGNKVYISLLSFVPVIGMFIPFLLGWKGNEWAWRKNKWENVENFKKVQKKWLMATIAVCLVSVIVSIFSISRMFSRLSTYQQLLETSGITINSSCTQNRINIQAAVNQAYLDGAITKEDRDESILETLAVLGYLSEIPKCHSGGHYFIKNGIVHCSIHDP